MASNNYFGFTHNGTQYTPTPGAAAAAAYQAQQGYAVAPTAGSTPAATYTTQRAATAYDYSTGSTAYAGVNSFAVQSAAPTPAAATTYDYGYARPAAQAYDTTKTYYQPPAASTTGYSTNDYNSGWTQASTAQKPAVPVSAVYTYSSAQPQRNTAAVQKPQTNIQPSAAAYSTQTYATQQPSTNTYAAPGYNTVQNQQNKFTAQAAQVKKPVQSYSTQPNVSYNTNNYVATPSAVGSSYSSYNQNKTSIMSNNKPLTLNKQITGVGATGTGVVSNVSTTTPTPNTNYSSSYDQALYNAATSMYASGTNTTNNTMGQNKPQWKNYKTGNVNSSMFGATGNTTGNAAGGFKFKKQPPKPQQLHYCEVCKISCAGPLTYKEHLDGSRHKKKEQAQKVLETTKDGSTSGSTSSKMSAYNTRGTVFKCDLCSVACTGTDAYSAHLRGVKHQKVVKLHQKLGKPIPEPDPKATAILRAKAEAAEAAKNGASKVIAAPKINFVASGNLASSKSASVEATPSEKSSEDIDMMDDNILPVGQEFLEEIKGDDGKLVTFNCKLCDCKFNDPNAKDMHMKGKRHRLAFKKKVDPSLVVEIKPSYFQKKQKEQRERMREQYARRREEERVNFWTDRLTEERMYWEERRRYEEDLEYYEWNVRRRMMGPMPPPAAPFRGGGGPANAMAPPMAPPLTRGPSGPLRFETFDDRHVFAKHGVIIPKKEELEQLNKCVDYVEKSLKSVSDILVEEVIKKEAITKPVIKKEGGATDEKVNEKDKKKDEDLKSLKEKEEKRVLKGVNRVGSLAKNILIQGERNAELVVLCAEKPTVTLLKEVVRLLPIQLKAVAPEEIYVVTLKQAESGFVIERKKEGADVTIAISLTSPIIREELLDAQAPVEETKTGETPSTPATTTTPVIKKEPIETPKKPDPKDMLNKEKCLEALASLRRTKWFQAKAMPLESCSMIIRLLRFMGAPWNLLHPWALELLVEKVLSCGNAPYSPGDAFRRVMEAISSGLLLPTGPGLADPCEKDPVDVLKDMVAQDREEITVAGQVALRQIAFHQIYKLLDMEQLKPKKNFARSNRKRRRDTSSGEKEDGGNKKDKKEETKKDGGEEVNMEAKEVVKQ